MKMEGRHSRTYSRDTREDPQEVLTPMGYPDARRPEDDGTDWARFLLPMSERTSGRTYRRGNVSIISRTEMSRLAGQGGVQAIVGDGGEILNQMRGAFRRKLDELLRDVECRSPKYSTSVWTEFT